MIEIRFHGRGGQGAVVASNILAESAFREGKDVQSFPYFGVERQGAPVTAYTRLDNKKILIKSQIYEPDYVVVLDHSLLSALKGEVTRGLKKNGMMIINTHTKPEEVVLEVEIGIATVDATAIAIKYRLGSKAFPIVNTAILGAFAKATNEVKLDSILDSIRVSAPKKTEENVSAAKEAYDTVIIGKAKIFRPVKIEPIEKVEIGGGLNNKW